MYIDLSHTFNSNMPVFPGDPSADLVQISDVAKDGVTHFQLKTTLHVGTHIDAPSHMLLGGKNLNEYPPEKFFGRGVIIDARGKSAVTEEILLNVEIKKGDIVLVCFGWDSEFETEEYYQNYPVLNESFAKKIVELGASIVGTDTPSPDRAPYAVHKILLGADVLILENLTNLDQLIGKNIFEVIALPVKFAAEAALCRVAAKLF